MTKIQVGRFLAFSIISNFLTKKLVKRPLFIHYSSSYLEFRNKKRNLAILLFYKIHIGTIYN